MKWPRFGSKKAGLDDKGREWIKASGVTDWLELDNVEGELWFVLVRRQVYTDEIYEDEYVSIPCEDDEIEVGFDHMKKRFHVLELLDVSRNGFKCLVLISEV